jgi:hypothetical protein
MTTMVQDLAHTRTLMFGIIRDPAKADSQFEYIFYDLLNDTDARVQFDRLQRVDVVFSGYTESKAGYPDGLDPRCRDAVSAVTDRLNSGEPLDREQIGGLLGDLLA